MGMLISFLAIAGVIVVSIRNADLDDRAFWPGAGYPVLGMLGFIALALWFVILLYKSGASQRASRGSRAGSDFDFGGFGDGGGDGGGCD